MKEFQPAIKRLNDRIEELKIARSDCEEGGSESHANTFTETIQCLYVAISVLELTEPE